ncbi:MAG TPA: nucleotidyltransferase domain-containing protein [Caulobacteraceae bacterium]|nr:nucleotidyltransferase domain-containing protein [Caulobacteraceae bacterium]
MDRKQALQILKSHQSQLSLRGVRRVALFGSVARDQSGPQSDLDILVQIDPAARLDLYSYTALTQYIGDLFPVRVDIANYEGLKAHLKASVERDAIYAF